MSTEQDNRSKVTFELLQQLTEERGTNASHTILKYAQWIELFEDSQSADPQLRKNLISKIKVIRNNRIHSYADMLLLQGKLICDDLHLPTAGTPQRRRWLSRASRQVQAPPGCRLRGIGDFLFAKGTFEAVIEPTLADLLMEFQEALADGRPWKARWVRIRGYWSFWSAVAAQAPLSLLKRIFELWKAA